MTAREAPPKTRRDGMTERLSSSIIHHPPSTIHHPSSTVHHPPSTIHHPSSIKRTFDRKETSARSIFTPQWTRVDLTADVLSTYLVDLAAKRTERTTIERVPTVRFHRTFHRTFHQTSPPRLGSIEPSIEHSIEHSIERAPHGLGYSDGGRLGMRAGMLLGVQVGTYADMR